MKTNLLLTLIITFLAFFSCMSRTVQTNERIYLEGHIDNKNETIFLIDKPIMLKSMEFNGKISWIDKIEISPINFDLGKAWRGLHFKAKGIFTYSGCKIAYNEVKFEIENINDIDGVPESIVSGKQYWTNKEIELSGYLKEITYCDVVNVSFQKAYILKLDTPVTININEETKKGKIGSYPGVGEIQIYNFGISKNKKKFLNKNVNIKGELSFREAAHQYKLFSMASEEIQIEK